MNLADVELILCNALFLYQGGAASTAISSALAQAVATGGCGSVSQVGWLSSSVFSNFIHISTFFKLQSYTSPPPTLAGTGPGSGIRTGPRFRHSQGVCPSHRSSPRRLRLPPCFGKFPRLTPSGIYSRAALSRTCSSGFEFTSLQALRGSQCPTSTHPPSFSHNFAVGPCWIHRNRFCPSFCLCPGETNCRR